MVIMMVGERWVPSGLICPRYDTYEEWLWIHVKVAGKVSGMVLVMVVERWALADLICSRYATYERMPTQTHERS